MAGGPIGGAYSATALPLVHMVAATQRKIQNCGVTLATTVRTGTARRLNMAVTKAERQAHLSRKLIEICKGILETAVVLEITDIQFDVDNNLKRAGPANLGYETIGHGTLTLKVQFAPPNPLPEPPVGIPIPPTEEGMAEPGGTLKPILSILEKKEGNHGKNNLQKQ